MSIKAATMIALIGCLSTILLKFLFYLEPYQGIHFVGLRLLSHPEAFIRFLVNNLAFIGLSVFLIVLYRKQ